MIHGKELWYALFAALVITTLYGIVVTLSRGFPRASSFFGHSLGILGFTLMLMTETLYSLRKRSRSARWGSMKAWLEFHIFTGLVGPYMALLHTSWKFNGLAGVVMAFTVTIVISGFIGRYLYTRVPRTLEGTELTGAVPEAVLRRTRQLMALWHAVHIPIGIALFVSAFFHIGAALYYATFLK